jgi:hypothetical protein
MNTTPKTRLKLLRRDLQLVQIDDRSRRQAAAVLEVLAGLRRPEQAAEALEVSLPTYYNLETRALRGLIWACAPQPPGRQQALTGKLRDAEDKAAELQQQLQRYQALLRTMQHSVNLSPAKEIQRASCKRRSKKPSVRAMRAIRALEQPTPAGAQPLAAAEEGAVANAT